MRILLQIFKYHLKVIYFFIKIFTPQKRQVCFLTRQTDTVPLNYQMLIDYIKKHDSSIQIKVSCKRVSENLNKIIHKKEGKLNFKLIFKELKGVINYYFTLYKQMYYIATSKIVIIDGYNVLISTLKHKKNTTVIQMWHALAAIKQFGFQSIGRKDGMNPKVASILKMHENYDYVLSGSEAMVGPFSEAFHTQPNKILPIGTPYIDYLLNKKIDKKEIYINYPQLKEKPILLYSPTFRKNGRNSIDEVVKSVDLEKYNLVITLHELDMKNVKDNLDDRIILNPKINYADLLKMADYVITDYSALMIEAAIMKTNILLYVYDYEQYSVENGLNINLFEELPKCVFKDFKDIMKVIEKDNYDRKTLINFRNKYITNLKGNSTEKLYRLVKKEVGHEKN